MASDDVDLVNDMVTPEQLSDLPGAPFDQDEVDRAVETVRAAVFWHIAPERTRFYTFDIPRMSNQIYLPTKHLVSVDSVTANGVPVDASAYEVSWEMAKLKLKRGWWPQGLSAVEVEMTHGYDTVPLELLNVVAAVAASSRRDQAVREAVAGTYTLPLVGIDNVIYRYIPLHKRFGMA